jgi:hypothetical protein
MTDNLEVFQDMAVHGPIAKRPELREALALPEAAVQVILSKILGVVETRSDQQMKVRLFLIVMVRQPLPHDSNPFEAEARKNSRQH